MIRSRLIRHRLNRYDFTSAVMLNRSANVCIVDRSGRFLLVNQGAEKMLGWSEAELTDKDLHITIHRCGSADHPERCPLLQAAQGSHLFTREDDVLRRKDGTTVPVTYLTSPLVLNNQIEGTVFVFQDVSQREQELLSLRESEERYRYLAEEAAEPMWLTDSFGYITMANNRAAELFGFTAWGQMLQLNALELFTLKDRPRAVQAKHAAAKEGKSSTAEYTLVCRHDQRNQGDEEQVTTADVRISPVLDAGGKLKAVLYAATMVPKTATADQLHSGAILPLEQAVALALSGSSLLGDTIPRLLQTVCESGRWDVGMYWQLDADDQVLRCSAFWQMPDVSFPGLEEMSRQLTFAPGVDLPGRAWTANEPVWVSDVVADSDILRALMASKEGLHGALCFPVSAGGALQGVMEFLSRAPRDRDAAMLRAADSASAQIGWFLERHQAEKAHRYQALHDSLTGLPNRALLLDRLRRALFVSRETGKPLALFVLDLDRFTEVNDAHGQHTGDEVLKLVAHRLSDALRDSDTVARLGGDEFAVLLPGTYEAGAVIVAQKIVEGLRDPVLLEGVSVTGGASIGIALYPDHGDDSTLLMRAADAAMCVAKRRASGYAIHSTWSDESEAGEPPRAAERV